MISPLAAGLLYMALMGSAALLFMQWTQMRAERPEGALVVFGLAVFSVPVAGVFLATAASHAR